LHTQGGDEGGTAVVGEVDFRGCGLIVSEIAEGVAVEAGGAVGMIQHVREKGRSMREFGMPDAGTVHAWDQLTR